MSNQSRIPSLVAGAMILLASGVSAAERCTTEGEQPLEFRFFTDNNSWKDNGWVLQCDYEDDTKELVWEVPIGSLKFDARTEVIREAACVPDTATCFLNIFDAKGDGLQGSKNGDSSTNSFEGWFAFLHGATTVATYKNLDEPKFSELSYCVGPKCDQKPQEIQTGDEDCQDMMYLAMQLDNNPQDTSYQLICGGEDDGVFDKKIIWDGKGFTQAGAYVEEETCLPKDSCCEFILVDGSSNGLTDAVDRTSSDSATGAQPMGFIYLEKNYESVLQYDGSTGETFGVMTKQFGCGADKVSIKDQEEDDKKADKEEEGIVAVEGVGVVEDDDRDDEEEEVQDEDVKGNEKLVIEVGNNVEGVFDPQQEEEQTDGLIEDVFGSYIDPQQQEKETTELIEDTFGSYIDPQQQEKETAELIEDTFGSYIDPQQQEEETAKLIKETFGSYTDNVETDSSSSGNFFGASGNNEDQGELFGFPENLISDDDFQHENDNHMVNIGFMDDDWVADDDYSKNEGEVGELMAIPGFPEYLISDDDYQHEYDDQIVDISFMDDDWVADDDFSRVNNGFTDDVTDYSNTWRPSSTSSTVAPTTFTNSFYDTSWTEMDDITLDMQDMDNMIQDLTDRSPKLPTDPNAIAFLKGESIYNDRKVGLSKNAKITLGVLIPIFLLWTIGLAGYYFRVDRGADDEALEKGTIGDPSSEISLDGGSIHTTMKTGDNVYDGNDAEV